MFATIRHPWIFRILLVSCAIAACAVLAGCAGLDNLTGKSDLVARVDSVSSALKDQKAATDKQFDTLAATLQEQKAAVQTSLVQAKASGQDTTALDAKLADLTTKATQAAEFKAKADATFDKIQTAAAAARPIAASADAGNAGGVVQQVGATAAAVIPPPFGPIVGLASTLIAGLFYKRANDATATADRATAAAASIVKGIEEAKDKSPALVQALKDSKGSILEHVTDDGHAFIEAAGAVPAAFQ